MKPVKANVTNAIPLGAELETCDNSGAKVVKVFTVIGAKTVWGRVASAGIGDLIMVSVKRGRPDMRKQTMFAVIVRQKREYKRPDGMRIKFEDNAVVILKDDKGNPQGTLLKGPIAKEVADRWPAVAKIASIIV
jgi:large subunit ribosomal protein L14